MRAAALGFALGAWVLQRQAALPDAGWIALFSGAALVAGLGFVRRCPRVVAAGATIAGFAALGFAWAAIFAHWRLADRLDAEFEGRDLVVTGVVAGLPQRFERGVRFEFEVELPRSGVPRRVVLAAYDGARREGAREPLRVRAGERWCLAVRLRRPHGGANPGGFDYEAWLFERGLRATGYVTAKGERERLSPFVASYGIERLREAVRDKLTRTLAERAHAGVLIALAIGDQRAIDAEKWQLFARTGVSHLMSISGLHVTMVAGLFALLVSWGWRRSETLTLRLPARKAAALAGTLAALAYCLVSGFAVPAQRTLYMVAVAALALWVGRAASASRVLSAALLVVLACDPWAVLSPGFWLSFAAVGIIFYVASARTGSPGALAQWGRVQWAVTVGLAPLLLVLFQQVSLISPAANAVAIPLVSIVITPLTLVGALLPFDWPLELAHVLLEWLMAALSWLASLPSAVWHQHAPPAWTVPLALVGVGWMLLPRGFPARTLGILLLLPMFAAKPPGPGAGALWVTALDVGQGLSVLVRTERHALLYDAGPAFHPPSDSGNRIVLPYLRSQGIDALDAVVVSHDDRDHSGGVASVLKGIPVAWLWSSLPEGHELLKAPVWRAPCVFGRRWSWDEVRFEFLGPPSEDFASGAKRINDRSCVLRIEAPGGRVLLTGDIERSAERELLDRVPERLRAETVLVPHHGSATSSSAEFVERVAPRRAIVAAGHRNRFGHPKDEVVMRYRRLGTELLRTDLDGALELRIEPGQIAVTRERERRRRYWQE